MKDKTTESETIQKNKTTNVIDDFRFLNITQKVIDGLKKPEKKSVKSQVKKFTHVFTPIANTLYSLLPEYLLAKHNVEYDNTFYFSRYKKELFEELVKALKLYKKYTSIKPILPKVFKFVENHDIKSLEKFVKLLKKDYYPMLKDPDDKKALLSFYRVFTSDNINDKSLKELLKLKILLDDLNLVRAVKLIHHKANSQDEERLGKVQKAIDVKTKKLFGTETPSFEAMQKISKSKPEAFKAWRKESNDLRSLGKGLLVEAWRLNGYTVEDVSIAEKLLKELKIPSTIDPEYKGKVSPGDTDAVQFKYYTSTGVQLEAVPGRNVVMNPEYDPKKDDTYYCKGLPASGSSDQIYAFYTLDYIKDRSDRLFTKARKASSEVEDLRLKLQDELKNENTPVKFNVALILSIIDITAGRIGNPKSEKLDPPTFGIHNLKAKHLKIEGGKAVLAYIGKGAKNQKHTITDKNIVSILAKKKKERKPNQYLFGKDPGSNPVSPSTVRKYLKDFGWEEANPHVFRKYHANKLFSELLEQEFKTKKGTLSAFDKTAISISKMLGNTKTVAINAYISPTLIDSFFTKNGFNYDIDKVPAVVINTLKKAGKI